MLKSEQSKRGADRKDDTGLKLMALQQKQKQREDELLLMRIQLEQREYEPREPQHSLASIDIAGLHNLLLETERDNDKKKRLKFQNMKFYVQADGDLESFASAMEARDEFNNQAARLVHEFPGQDGQRRREQWRSMQGSDHDRSSFVKQLLEEEEATKNSRNSRIHRKKASENKKKLAIMGSVPLPCRFLEKKCYSAGASLQACWVTPHADPLGVTGYEVQAQYLLKVTEAATCRYWKAQSHIDCVTHLRSSSEDDLMQTVNLPLLFELEEDIAALSPDRRKLELLRRFCPRLDSWCQGGVFDEGKVLEKSMQASLKECKRVHDDEMHKGEEFILWSGDSNSLLIPLQEGTYTICVRAVNALGVGPWSVGMTIDQGKIGDTSIGRMPPKAIPTWSARDVRELRNAVSNADYAMPDEISLPSLDTANKLFLQLRKLLGPLGKGTAKLPQGSAHRQELGESSLGKMRRAMDVLQASEAMFQRMKADVTVITSCTTPILQSCFSASASLIDLQNVCLVEELLAYSSVWRLLDGYCNCVAEGAQKRQSTTASVDFWQHEEERWPVLLLYPR